jgi:hypothetical protein
VQRHCPVHRCPVGEKTRLSKGGETQPQHRDAHDPGFLCLWDLFHGVDHREGNGSLAAPGLSGGLGRTGTRFETAQSGELGGPPAAPRDADHPKKVPDGHPPSEWSWNQRFAFGAVGGRKQRKQIREGITRKRWKEGTIRYDTIRYEACMLSFRIGLPLHVQKLPSCLG